MRHRGVDRDRMVDEFLSFVQVDSLSKKEKHFSKIIEKKLKELRPDEFYEDDVGKKINGDCGNLVARFKGVKKKIPPLLLCAHIDTVVPGENIKPIVDKGIIRSQGDTILGADDKSGVVLILEALRVLREQKIPHGELEIVFAVAEEIGLLGSKHLDYSKLHSRIGYALDHPGTYSVVTAAPSSHKMIYRVHGLESHAGVSPEKGINAIQVAAEAISYMKLGRIDDETTANVGMIQGGRARNIVPNFVEIVAEARSHNYAKLKSQTEQMRQTFAAAIKKFRAQINGESKEARLEEEFIPDYQAFKISEKSYVVKLVKEAGKRLQVQLTFERGGGGSDANYFNANGIESIVLPTGMTKPHTLSEYIAINDFVFAGNLLVEIIKTHAEGDTK